MRTMILSPDLPGFTLSPLAASDIPAFTELGLPTCAFMHGRPETSPEKMRVNFTQFVREYAFEHESEIYVVKAPDQSHAAQLWLHSTHNRFNGFHEMWVWDLTVREDHRRRGIGRLLLEFAQTRAELKGCTELWLLVSSINDKAVKLYQTFGMDFAGHLMSKPVANSRSSSDRPGLAVELTEFRLLTASDIPQLYELWEAAALAYKPAGRDRSDRLGRHLNQSGGGGWGAYYGQTLIAAAIFSFDGRKGYIEHLATRPDFRRSGLAEAVVAASLQSLKELGALVTAALIESANIPSRRLFETLGFIDSPSLCYYSLRDNNEA